MMTIRLADLSLDDVAADAVMLSHERVTRAAALLGPLVSVELGSPRHDLPDGVPMKAAIRRSFAYGTELGLLVRDVVHYAKTGKGFKPEDATAALVRANHALGLDLDREPSPTFEIFTSPMQVVRHAVLGRVLLATGGDIPPSSLAALAGLEPGGARAIIASGELAGVNGSVSHAHALRWLRARRVPGL